MKNEKAQSVSEEKNPQQLFEEIQNQDLSGISSAELRRRMEIVHNAMDYNLNKSSRLLENITTNIEIMLEDFKMIA